MTATSSSSSSSSSSSKEKFIAALRKMVDDAIRPLVKKERDKCDNEILDEKSKWLYIKYQNEDTGPYRRRLLRRYKLERARRIREASRALAVRKREITSEIKTLLNDTQDYVTQLQSQYDITLKEHRRTVYEMYIKRASTRTYCDYLRSVAYKTYYTTLASPLTTTWRKHLTQQKTKTSADDDPVASTLIGSTVVDKIGNVLMSPMFMVFYSSYIPYSRETPNYLQKVVIKVNRQVEVVNNVCPTRSCFLILRDLLLDYHDRDVADTIKYTVKWMDDNAAAFAKYFRSERQQQQHKAAAPLSADDDDDDIFDARETYRRVNRNIDRLIIATFRPMNDSAFLCRRYFDLENMSNPMIYLSMQESSYNLVYNLYLELLLIQLVYKVNASLGLAPQLDSSAFFDVINGFQEPETVINPLTVAQTLPGFIVLIIIHTACPRVQTLFRYDVTKPKRRDEICRYQVDLAMAMIPQVIKLLNDPSEFIANYRPHLMNGIFIRTGVPISV